MSSCDRPQWRVREKATDRSSSSAALLRRMHAPNRIDNLPCPSVSSSKRHKQRRTPSPCPPARTLWLRVPLPASPCSRRQSKICFETNKPGAPCMHMAKKRHGRPLALPRCFAAGTPAAKTSSRPLSTYPPSAPFSVRTVPRYGRGPPTYLTT
ncbi:hypothetical protein BDY21DRAFT_354062 [Lineolata rhizophorae]|uniref:Uncharacterized protein n=1 Tax=Lineolata rhizophorae TaxID=578093 RepID=A0A6A6NRF3_9PEZI|nr:hypothetical protein BDY21DRAFT_354062 [Lineolata rhizophorae]